MAERLDPIEAGPGATFAIGGTATGFGGELILQNNAGDDLPLTAEGSFQFFTRLAEGSAYDVTISRVAHGNVCTLANPTGTVGQSDIEGIRIACSALKAPSPLYSKGKNLNDYVKADGTNAFDATDTTCAADSAGDWSACLNGGMFQALTIAGRSDCADLAAEDDLGVFNWTCDASVSPIRVVSVGLKEGKGLGDLIDSSTLEWRENSVTIKSGPALLGSSLVARWWANPLSEVTGSASLSTSGSIYVVRADTAGLLTIEADKVGLVVMPGVVLKGSPSDSGSAVVTVDFKALGVKLTVDFQTVAGGPFARDFVWIEGMIDAQGHASGIDGTGVGAPTVKAVGGGSAPDAAMRFSVLRNVSVSGATDTGAALRLKNSRVEGLLATNSGREGVSMWSEGTWIGSDGR